MSCWWYVRRTTWLLHTYFSFFSRPNPPTLLYHPGATGGPTVWLTAPGSALSGEARIYLSHTAKAMMPVPDPAAFDVKQQAAIRIGKKVGGRYLARCVECCACGQKAEDRCSTTTTANPFLVSSEIISKRCIRSVPLFSCLEILVLGESPRPESFRRARPGSICSFAILRPSLCTPEALFPPINYRSTTL